tara:strand:+ start:2379 stop:2585 length:207 start_codon:yes stop_codon:yes gene_type:complete
LRSSSVKQQATSGRRKQQANAQGASTSVNQNLVQVLKLLDASIKPQAVRLKPQALSIKLLDYLPLIKF